jgi:SPX domain protein involved in polyphosphate accumulation
MDAIKTDSTSTQNLSPGQLEAVARVKSTPKKAGVDPNKMLAKRYELKYRIPEAMAEKVKGFVTSYIGPDPYTKRWPNGQYPICSMYFDSIQFDLFRETVLDKANRFKLRIRGYDDEPNSPVFFEIKRKLNGIIYKSRAKAGKDQIAEILKGHFLPPQATEKDRATLKQFVHYTHCLMARPIVSVKYKREAFEGETETRARITFDRELQYCCMDRPIFKMNGNGWKKLPINFVVLEIKFTNQFPAWLVELTRMFDLNRQSMSKYCNSVRQLTPSGVSVSKLL